MSQQITKEDVLAQVKAAFGFVPNLMEGMADASPATAAAYLAASGALEGSVLTPVEKQVVMLAVSSWNECHYCTAAHRTAAKGMGIVQAELEAIDGLTLPTDERLRTLVQATWKLVETRGWLEDGDEEALGLTRGELYELIAIIGLKTISNYVNHIQRTEVDAPFRAQQKRNPSESAA